MKKRPVWQFVAAALLFLAVVPGRATVKSEMDALTGNLHTRVVWLEGGHYYDGGGTVKGYDSHTDATHTILSDQGYRKPILCSGGNRVVVSSDDWKVYVIDFAASTSKEFLVDGYCSDVWIHPQTGQEWFFVRNSNTVKRHLLGDPSQSVHLYSGSSGHPSVNWWMVSADGTVGADFLPWPSGYYITNAAGLDAQSASAQSISNGCWASFSSDNSYYWFHLNGDHHYIKMFHQSSVTTSNLYVNAPAPSNHNAQIYHPRFASKGGRYMTCSAGYDGNGASNYAEICLGKFNSSYSGFDGWVKVTSNSVFDNNADAWVGVTGLEPSIALSPDSLSFNAEEGGANPVSQTVTVSSPVGSLTNVAVSESASWLSVSLSGGTITNSVDIAGLSADVHSTTVTVTADNASPSTATYTVSLTVVGAPVATSLEVSPRAPMLLRSETQQFAATVLDQYGNALNPQPSVSWSASGSGGSISGSGLFTAASAEGSATVVAQAGALRDTATVTVVEQAPVSIRINCGGSTVGEWESDVNYVVSGEEGGTYTFGGTHDVSGVTEPAPNEVYQTVRNQNHQYTFSEVPDGEYTVRIHFTDAYGGGRAMNYTIEDEQVLSDYSVVDAAGGTNTAIVEEFTVRVSDGNGLQIVCDKGTGTDVFEAGIEVLSTGGTQPAQIVITAPTAGDTVRVGETLRIEWSCEEDLGMNVHLSLNDGETWEQLTTGTSAPTTGGTGVFEKVVTEAMVSNFVRVKVSDYWDAPNATVSDLFTIAPSSAVAVVGTAAQVRGATVRVSAGRLLITVAEAGPHEVTVLNPAGRRLARFSGTAPEEYVWGAQNARGLHFVRIRAAGRENTIAVLPGK